MPTLLVRSPRKPSAAVSDCPVGVTPNGVVASSVLRIAAASSSAGDTSSIAGSHRPLVLPGEIASPNASRWWYLLVALSSELTDVCQRSPIMLRDLSCTIKTSGGLGFAGTLFD